jgi:hypothetical protein
VLITIGTRTNQQSWNHDAVTPHFGHSFTSYHHFEHLLMSTPTCPALHTHTLFVLYLGATCWGFLLGYQSKNVPFRNTSTHALDLGSSLIDLSLTISSPTTFGYNNATPRHLTSTRIQPGDARWCKHISSALAHDSTRQRLLSLLYIIASHSIHLAHTGIVVLPRQVPRHPSIRLTTLASWA